MQGGPESQVKREKHCYPSSIFSSSILEWGEGPDSLGGHGLSKVERHLRVEFCLL